MNTSNIIQINANNIEKQYFTTIRDDIRELGNPLKFFGIIHFSHVRRWADGSYSLFTSDPEFSIEFVKQKFYKKVFGGHAHQYKSGIVFMQDIEENVLFIKRACIEIGNFKPDLMITECNDEYTDFYWFGTSCNQENVRSLYLNHLEEIKSYLNYFKYSGTKLLTKIYNNKLMNDECGSDITPLVQDDFYKNIGLQQKVEVIKNSTAFYHAYHKKFTPKELSCALYLCEGYTTKEISNFLHVSSRTIEKHLINIRHKMKSRNLIHLVTSLLKDVS